ncbi:MAG: hypothetical protein H7A37_04965 [Chlamydiales bacterium]|nr:hypothetical protein [Chlamydiia bacterium]MCP5507633.1 hypothetical protein [Chlamydiales bacterium]
MGIGYLRSSYERDQINFIKDTNRFDGEILQTEFAGKYVTYEIDGAVKVKTVAQSVRCDATSYWNCKNTKARALMGISAVALSISIIAVVSIFTAGTALVVGGLFVVAAGVSLVALAIGIAKGAKAQNQLDQWKDPAQEASSHRRTAYFNGYPYIKKYGLQGRIVGNGEVGLLSLKYLDQLHDDFSGLNLSGKKVQLVDRFFDHNPLGSDDVRKAFFSDLEFAEELQSITVQYEEINRQYVDICNLAAGRRREIKRTFTNARADLMSKRELALAPLRKEMYARLSASERERQHVRLRYTMLSSRIENYYHEILEQLNRTERMQLDAVQIWEDGNKLTFFSPAKEVLEAYKTKRMAETILIDPPEVVLPKAENTVTIEFPSINWEEFPDERAI